MTQHASIPLRQLLALFMFVLGVMSPLFAAAEVRLSEGYGRLPLHFEANRGQTDEQVRFLARGPRYGLYLTANEAVLVLAKPNTDATPEAQIKRARPEDGIGVKRSAQKDAKTHAEATVLRMSLIGASPKPLVSGLDELPGKANYFVGKDPSKWRTNVPTYAKVHYREVYPGIDLVYYGNQRQLEYDFVVAPGADPKKIALSFKGADKLEIDAQGDLVLHTDGGDVRLKKPVVYQEVDGVRQEIEGSYALKSANQVSFQVAAYNTSRPLVIDPLVLSYSSYLGGGDIDQGYGVAADANGNAYVTGHTYSADFPTTLGAFQPASVGGGIFVTKLDPIGSTLVYSTYLGGGADWSFGISVDADGNAYVTGHASGSLPTTPGAFQPSSGGGGDAFVTKLNPTGSLLVYSTFLGGSDSDQGFSIAVDAGGNAYVTGRTVSTNFPTTPEAFQANLGGGWDNFVTKLNPTGSALVYSTYLGGSSGFKFNPGPRIAVDADGNAYVTGGTESVDFPTTAAAFQPIYGGGPSDAFVTKLNPTGSGLVYSTYLGGTNADLSYGIAVDAGGNAFVTGWASSGVSGVPPDFPTTAGAFQATCSTADCAIVTKLDPSGSTLVYSTFLGGSSGGSGGRSIAVDANGSAYVLGETSSTDFPITAGAFQPIYGGGDTDAFFTKLSPTGSALIYSTYLGGLSAEAPTSIAVDPANSAYVTGWTIFDDFPTTAGAFQPSYGGGSTDAFVAKFSDVTRFEESAATYTGTWTSYGAETGSFSGGAVLASSNAMNTASFTFTGSAVTWIGVKCSLCGIATVSIDGGAPVAVNTAGPASSNFTSEPVFTASGLDPAAPHTLVITVTGVTTSVWGAPFGSNVAVDAFDVTQ